MENKIVYKIKNVICKECGNYFIIDIGEQKFYASKELQEPKRCLSCRVLRKYRRTK